MYFRFHIVNIHVKTFFSKFYHNLIKLNEINARTFFHYHVIVLLLQKIPVLTYISQVLFLFQLALMLTPIYILTNCKEKVCIYHCKQHDISPSCQIPCVLVTDLRHKSYLKIVGNAIQGCTS